MYDGNNELGMYDGNNELGMYDGNNEKECMMGIRNN